MSKYRFKTEEEFKRDGLWKEDRPFKWVKDMLKYLGTDIPDNLTRHCDKQEKIRHEHWHIEPCDYVLKESFEGVSMETIQEEAKKRFPIGCKFIAVDSDKTHTLIEDSCTYKIRGKYIWAHNGHGHLYEDGKWATLVSLPETTKEMFYEGDYIVTLDVEDNYNCARKNYCFKQRITNKGIYPAVDLQGSKGNGHTVMSFNKTQYLKDWRYATPEEAAEYERIGKPYDVTTLQKKEESIPEYVECVRKLNNATVGKIYRVIDATNCESNIPTHKYSWKTSDYIPSTKEAYDAQNTSKKLTKEDLVEGEIYFYDNRHTIIYPSGPAFYDGKYESNVNLMWFLPTTHATEEQKALLRREIERNSKPDVMWHSDPIVEQRISIPSMKKQKFKIGDKVKIIQRKTSNRTGNCPGWDIANGNVGEIGVITYYSEPVRPYYVSQIGSDGYIGSFDEEDLELYQKEETTFYSNTELDFGRLDLEDWLRETKKLNLSLKKLTLHIEYGNTCNYSKVYNKLECEEDSPHSRAKYLYKLWNSKLKKDFIEKEVIKETFIDNVQSVDVILRTKRKSIKF